MVNKVLVSAGTGVITPNLTNLILPQGKAAVHPLAEKLTLYIIKFNTMED